MVNLGIDDIASIRKTSIENPKNGDFYENWKFHSADEIQNDSKISSHVIWSSYPIFQYKTSKFWPKMI